MSVRLLSLLAALACAACGDSHYIGWTTIADLPPGAVLTPDWVVVPQGTAIGARPSLFDSNDEQVDCQPALTSANPDVLRVTESTRGTPVLSGVSVGKTLLTAHCSEASATVAAEVIAQ